MKKAIILAILAALFYAVFTYIRAQRQLGAARTSAFYAIAPFAGSFLAFVIVGEALSVTYFAGLFLMLIGTGFVIFDTLAKGKTKSPQP